MAGSKYEIMNTSGLNSCLNSRVVFQQFILLLLLSSDEWPAEAAELRKLSRLRVIFFIFFFHWVIWHEEEFSLWFQMNHSCVRGSYWFLEKASVSNIEWLWHRSHNMTRFQKCKPVTFKWWWWWYMWVKLTLNGFNTTDQKSHQVK